MTNVTYQLFYDDSLAAIRMMIELSGKSYKGIASALWPAMKPESAYARLKNAVHPEKDEKLDLAEVAFLCKLCGRADALMWLVDETSHERPKAKNPEDEKTHLMRQFVSATSDLKRIEQLLEPLLRAERS